MDILNIDTKVKLNNGIEMPIFGFGTFRINAGFATRDCVKIALGAGYRSIDCAAIYANEKDVGDAIKQSGIPRDEIFITTKVWNTAQGYDNTLKAFDVSLEKLGLEHIDLYLLHWPVKGLRLESWKALEKLYEDGKCRAIGVSNFIVKHLEEILENSSITPTVNQVEFSPYTFDIKLLDFCRSHKIQLEAYSPLTKSFKLKDPKLIEVAEKYSKSTAQILLRWAVQKEIIVISKSKNRDRINENANIFDFEITEEDMNLLDSFNESLRTGWDPYSEEWD
jgi:diketogulonate reductase-like aldo/keto reductase